MNNALHAVLTFLFNKRYIGAKHTPEQKLIVSKTKWLTNVQKKSFEREYKDCVNNGLLLRSKKRTGKGSGLHVSLHPRKLKEVLRLLKEQ